jgi:DNA polymerase III subunit alpha
LRTDWVGLHNHSEGSFLDGIGTVAEYAAEAARLGQPAAGLTDHGNVVQLPQFYLECKKAGIGAVLGMESYYVSSFEAAKQEKDRERAHITVLARGTKGYSVLTEFSTAQNEQFYYKPLIDRSLCEALGKDARYLTILSGCAGSQLSRYLLAGDEHAAIEELMWWRETFKHYYIEIMHHGTPFDMKLNVALLDLARRYQVPWVVTNDAHYCYEHEAIHHDLMLAIQTGKDVNDPERLRFDGEGYFYPSRNQLYRRFKAAGYDREVFRRGAANSVAIAQDCVGKIKQWESKTWQIPKFPDVEDSEAELERVVKQGLRRIGKSRDPVYVQQTKDELASIARVGIWDFLLITRGEIRWALDRGIRVGPGRGSVAGSLVAYCAELHKIDPIKYGLRFDRFLNEQRPKLPDIDTDFQKSRREEVIRHAIKKYGEENTMQVAAYNSLQVKAAFNSIALAYGLTWADAHRLNKLILEMENPETGELEFALPDEVVRNHPEVTAHLHRLAGVKRGIGAHPAGLIIAAPETQLKKQIPEMWIASSKRWVSAYDKKIIEKMGLLKQDFLGLRALDTLAECIALVKIRRNLTVEPDEWIPDEEPDDSKVYKMLAAGRTSGVFQMEGNVNQRGCRDVRPKSFEDLVSITSLYRTGPIAAGYPAQFISNRIAGKSEIEYLHPLLKPILDPTWGVILYQEQVMDIGEKLAGFDMGQVDDIKEAIKDKSSSSMDTMRPMFIKGCKRANSIDRDTASAIWDIIAGYAGYGYNRSHAVAYTMLTYQTARLKYLYPVEFYTALLRSVPNDKDNAERRDGYIRDAIAESGAIIEPADVNASDVKAWPAMDRDAIRFGLADLKGIGAVQARKVVRSRPSSGYSAVEQVAEAVNNTGIMSILERASALECLGIKGDQDTTEELSRWRFRDDMTRWRRKYRRQLVPPRRDGGEVVLIGMIYKVTRGTTKTRKPYMTWKIRWSVTEAWDVRMWSGSCERMWDLKEGSVVKVTGEWQRKWLNVTVERVADIRVLHAVR